MNTLMKIAELFRGIISAFNPEFSGYTVRLGGPRPDLMMMFAVIGTANWVRECTLAVSRARGRDAVARAEARLRAAEERLRARIALGVTLGLLPTTPPEYEDVLGVLGTLNSSPGRGVEKQVMDDLRAWARAEKEKLGLKPKDDLPEELEATEDVAMTVGLILTRLWPSEVAVETASDALDDLGYAQARYEGATPSDIPEEEWARAQAWLARKLALSASAAPAKLLDAAEESARMRTLINLIGKEAKEYATGMLPVLQKDAMEILQLADQLEDQVEAEYGAEDPETASPKPFRGPFGGMFH